MRKNHPFPSQAAPVVYCQDARFCDLGGRGAAASDRRPLGGAAPFLVVLGAHHLARYAFEADDADGRVLSLSDVTGWPDPRTSALYNFEQYGAATDLDASTSRLLDHLFPKWAAVDHLWDYSAANVLNLARGHGLYATHVPLGYEADALSVDARPTDVGRGAPEETRGQPAAGVPAAARDVDVLFVGKLNAYRTRLLESLRYDHGLVVYHGNADAPLFGDELRSLLDRAKIVLSLSYFGSDDEWKMTRFLPAIAHGALVVAQRGGARVEQDAWADAVLFVARADTDDLATALRAYLANDTARLERVAAASALLRSRPASLMLKRPAEALVRAACPGWQATSPPPPPPSPPWQWDIKLD